MAVYYFYAKNFRWEPETVRRLSIREEYWLRVQQQAADAAQEVLIAEQARQQ